MIPLRDNIPPRTTPAVNYAILGFTSLVFAVQLFEEGGERHEGGLVERYGLIPARLSHPDRPVLVPEIVPRRTIFGVELERVEREAALPALPVWLTLLSCIFLHGGWMHFLGNMWFLHIFGDNVEDRFGHAGYLLFYLVSGIAASGAHLLANLDSQMPTIGSSGAIAGVMGAYFLLYPRAKVVTLVPLFFFIEVLVLPAPLFLGLWFLLQLFQGTHGISSTETGGVAWWAHIGGFVVGMLVAYLLRSRGVLRPKVEVIRPSTDRLILHHYGPWQGRRRS